MGPAGLGVERAVRLRQGVLASVNIGFWRGVQLDDPAGILEGEGDRMKHLTLREGDEVQADELSAFVRQAVELNRELGSPASTR